MCRILFLIDLFMNEFYQAQLNFKLILKKENVITIIKLITKNILNILQTYFHIKENIMNYIKMLLS